MTEQPKQHSRLYRTVDACLGTFRGEIALVMVFLGFIIGAELGYQTLANDLESRRPIGFFATRVAIETQTASVTPTPTKVVATAVPVSNSVQVR